MTNLSVLTNPVNQAAKLLTLGILGLTALMSGSVLAKDMEKFYGYWAPVDEEWCDLSKEEWQTEGAQMIISKSDFFIGYTSCSEVRKWMKGDRLQLSASCSGEGGPESMIREFWIEADGKLYYRDGLTNERSRAYQRCSSLQ